MLKGVSIELNLAALSSHCIDLGGEDSVVQSIFNFKAIKRLVQGAKARCTEPKVPCMPVTAPMLDKLVHVGDYSTQALRLRAAVCTAFVGFFRTPMKYGVLARCFWKQA